MNIYALQRAGSCEVVDFLEGKTRDKPEKGHRLGLVAIIKKIADAQGYELPCEMFDSWSIGKKAEREMFCEIRKGRRCRISCFKYDSGRRLLLTTAFMKTRPVEFVEYDRAIRLKKAFDANPSWSENA